MKLKKTILFGVLTSMLFANNIYAQQDQFWLEGNSAIRKLDERIEISPYNRALLLGSGESGNIDILTEQGLYQIPVGEALRRISDVYCDRIIKKDGLWVIERNIQKVILDGSESWEKITNIRWANKETSLFTIDLPSPAKIKDTICSHFQILPDASDKTVTVDCFSIDSVNGKVYLKIKNFRNIGTIEQLRAYLNNNIEKQDPMSFLYVLEKPIYETLPEQTQQLLNTLEIDKVGFTDNIIPTIVTKQSLQKPELPFLSSNSWTYQEEDISWLGNAILDMKIYNGNPQAQYVIYNLLLEGKSSLQMDIAEKSENNEYKIVCSATIDLTKTEFSSEKVTEIEFKPVTEEEISASARIKFLLFQLPDKNLERMTQDITGIDSSAVTEVSLITPKFVPVTKTDSIEIFYDNLILNGQNGRTGTITAKSDSDDVTIKENSFLYSPSENSLKTEITVTIEQENNKEQNSVVSLIPVSKQSGTNEEKTILFLGDSLINQDYYTQSLSQIVEQDTMTLHFIGTRGQEGSLHEGRGGWAAYDYCRQEKKYGVDNPFLNNGKFDFSYYMEKNQFDAPDYVVLLLGLNDLNLEGHNNHLEILRYYEEIIADIRKYHADTKILVVQSIPPFAKGETELAKNKRLDFMNTLQQFYENRTQEGIYLLPLYLNIDTFNDFKFVLPTPTAKEPSLSMKVEDVTHVAVSGYEKMAQTTYYYIKYLESLDE